MPSNKTETISKTKARNAAIAAKSAALQKIPKEIVDQLVTGPMNRVEFNDLSMALNSDGEQRWVRTAMGSQRWGLPVMGSQ
jgi:putative transposase